jgi:hypothetical protein
LIDRGADANVVSTGWHMTPLTAAANQPEKARYLIERGAQPIDCLSQDRAI